MNESNGAYIRHLEEKLQDELKEKTAGELKRLGECYSSMQDDFKQLRDKELKELREAIHALELCAAKLKDNSGFKRWAATLLVQAVVSFLPALGVVIYFIYFKK